MDLQGLVNLSLLLGENTCDIKYKTCVYVVVAHIICIKPHEIEDITDVCRYVI